MLKQYVGIQPAVFLFSWVFIHRLPQHPYIKISFIFFLYVLGIVIESNLCLYLVSECIIVFFCQS